MFLLLSVLTIDNTKEIKEKIYRIRDRFTLIENFPENLIKNFKMGSSCEDFDLFNTRENTVNPYISSSLSLF